MKRQKLTDCGLFYYLNKYQDLILLVFLIYDEKERDYIITLTFE